jgi:ParB-like chromosome segregation protein Spo0J
MSKKTFEDVPIDIITCPVQVREYFDPYAQEGLAMTVRERGVQVPVALYRRDGKLHLKDGARRIRAAIAAGQKTVPAIIDLTALEKARAIASAMKSTGASAAQIAAKLGFANGTVSKLLSLLSLPEPIQQRIHSGELPASAGYRLSQVSDSGEQDHLANQVASGELTRDGLSDAIKSRKQSPRKKRHAAPRSARVTAKLKDRQSVTVIAPSLDLHSFVTILETLLGRARQASAEGLTLNALLKQMSGRSPAADEPTISNVESKPEAGDSHE